MINKPTRPQLISLSARESALVVGVSLGFFYRLDANGGVPAPRRLGRRKLWDHADLRAWMAAGAPIRSAWEEMNGRAAA